MILNNMATFCSSLKMLVNLIVHDLSFNLCIVVLIEFKLEKFLGE